MALFNFFKKRNPYNFKITETDQKWVDDSFRELIYLFGPPAENQEQYTLTAQYFPRLIGKKDSYFDDAVEDVCQLLKLDSRKIKFDFQKDNRDLVAVPYVIEGKTLDSLTEFDGKHYTITFASSLIKSSNRLLLKLILELLAIKLYESKVFSQQGDIQYYFLFLMGIYMGFGVILSENLSYIGRNDDAFWRNRWNYTEDMPEQLIAYGLALWAKMTDNDEPDWVNELSERVQAFFKQALIKANHNSILAIQKNDSKKEEPYAEKDPFNSRDTVPLSSPDPSYSKYNELFDLASRLAANSHFQGAIDIFQKSILLVDDNASKAVTYNNIGYFQTRLNQYQESLQNFKLAIKLDPEFAYAYDNLGYSLIQLGLLEEGKKHIDRAMKTKRNHSGYSSRNLAVYFWKKGEIRLANKYFEKAFFVTGGPVDRLELHYCDFLIEHEEMEKALTYLHIAVNRGELEAINRINELNSI